MKRVMTVMFAGLILCSLVLVAGCEETTPEDEEKLQKRDPPATQRQAPGPGAGGNMDEGLGEAVERPEEGE